MSGTEPGKTGARSRTTKSTLIVKPTYLQFPEAFELLDVNDIHVSARGAADTELLSRSDMACLLDAARKYGKMPAGRLKNLSHKGKAFENADTNCEMKPTFLL